MNSGSMQIKLDLNESTYSCNSQSQNKEKTYNETDIWFLHRVPTA
jgi:hypothetical protein